jgi:multidrug efflux pump subunit AcrA (membrane-fusion protein)
MTVMRDGETTDERGGRWWRRRGVIVPVIVLVLLLAGLLIWRSCRSAPAAEEAAGIVVSVQVAKAERGAIANDITTVATLAPRQQADIMPKVAAQIRELPLLLNRSVHAHDVLVVLEARDLSAQLAETRAAVEETQSSARTTASGLVPLANAQDAKAVRDAQATLDNARKTYERRRTLFAEGGISKKELEASQLAVTLAEDDLHAAESASRLHRGVTNPGDITVANAKAQQARNRLANLEAQVGYTVIRAPFDGVVTAQYQHQGDFAAPGTKILSIADASTLIARMNVSEATASMLKQGDVATVIPDDLPNETISGTISLVGRGADVQSRSVEVWVMVPNAAGRLRANGLARVSLAAQATSTAVVIPSSAVTLDATNANSGTVMVVDAKSIAHETHVTTGIRSGGRTQILSGLSGGETVVTEGNYGLPDGTKVALAGAEPKEAPAKKAAAGSDD